MKTASYFSLLLSFATIGCATVRPVAPNELYRSGQLSATQLEQAIDEHRIRTVINLRGFHPDEPWYQQESDVCRRMNVRQVDITLNTEQPEREEVIRLIEAYRTVEKPILVHSYSRNGRVGFGAGMYRLVVLNDTPAEARKELAPWEFRGMPTRHLGGLDNFIYHWPGEDTFYATYELPRQNLDDLLPLTRPVDDAILPTAAVTRVDSVEEATPRSQAVSLGRPVLTRKPVPTPAPASFDMFRR